MKHVDKRQRLHHYIHRKQEDIQRKFQDFRSQYEHSGKTRFLLAQSECQGAIAAYQDILRMYGMHITYDRPILPTSDVPDHSVPDAASRAGTTGTGGMLQVLQTYCQKKHREAEQKNARCREQHTASGDNKYLFLQRQYAGEVMAYRHIGNYIHTLDPLSDSAETEQPAAAQQSETHPASAAASGLLHILVMESSSLIRKSIEMILNSEGFTVTTASDGVIGLDIAQKVSPDLILMDSVIARQNEEQLTFILRHERRLRKIPVILLEGSGRSFDEHLSTQLGVTASIKKPFQPDELVQTIRASLPE